MKRLRILASLLAAALLSGLLGCDVALVAVLASRNKSSSKATSSTTSPPDVRYFVYGATLSIGTESTELNTIKTAGGNPGSNWTLLGGNTMTADFVFAGGMNAVLIQATTLQAYDIDSVEGHDASDHVVSIFSTTTFSDQMVGNTNNIAGFPDGLTVTAQATSGQNAIIFQILPTSATPVTTVRIFIAPHLGSRASGDPNWIASWVRGGDQSPGGASSNSVGTTFFGATDVGTQAQWLLAVDGLGVIQTGGTAIMTLEAGTAVSVGNISIGVDQDDTVVVANVSTNSLAAGNSAIRWRKLQPTTALPPVWSNPALWDQSFAGAGINLVGSNALSIDSSHNVIFAGGNDVGSGPSKNARWMRKVNGGTGGEVWTQTGPLDQNSTFWRAIALAPSDGVVTAGDITTGVSGPIEILVRATNSSNTTTSDATYVEPSTQADSGQTIAVDGSGNSYVGGYLGVSGPSKNAVMLKVPSGTSTPAQWFLETANAPSEIMGLLSLSDGTLYAVGYETVTAQSPVGALAQGRNIIVLKIDPSGTLLWKRIYDSGQGDDQAVSATLTSSSLVVVGQVSTASSGKDVFVVSYAR